MKNRKEHLLEKEIPFIIRFFSAILFFAVGFFFIKYYFFPYSIFIGIFSLITGIAFLIGFQRIRRFIKKQNKEVIEYRAYSILRIKIKLPFFFRIFFASILIFIGLAFIILPVFPASLVVGVFLFVIGFILIIKVDKIRYLIKLRRSIIYMFTNFFKKETRIQKINDIKRDIKKIFEKNSTKKN